MSHMASRSVDDLRVRDSEPDAQRSAACLKRYKALLQDILNKRPSGTRRRLATALGKNPSFISQIANPVYSVPIPVSHLEIVFEICHFSAEAREAFLQAYDGAHPGRLTQEPKPIKRRSVTVQLPDLGDERRNQKLDAMMHDFAQQLGELMTED